MEQQSKQESESKRKKEAESANGTSNGAHEFAPELHAQVTAAVEAEKQSLEKGIDAWKKLVVAAPTAWPPRRELARVYKRAERWNAFIEVMKEALEKATWIHPDEKIPVLLEMVEIYRDRLKLDVMVVNAFNQILSIQPENLPASDALAAQFEQMKRWPDLISLLRRRASVVTDPSEKVELQLRVANLFLEKFSNQVEAIKAFEQVLDIEPKHTQALAFLKQMYEKRRDWDKLIAIHQREIAGVADAAERRARRVEVARLASEKLKKPALSIDLWKQVIDDDPQSLEALSELEKLFEREKAWTDLAEVLQRQVSLAEGDAPKQAALLVKLGTLYTDKVNLPNKAIEAWRGLLDREPENRRAQDALKKLYLQQRDWDALEQFYAVHAKWDELVRVLERQAESEDGPAGRLALWNKIGEIYRDRLSKADKAQKAFEKALSIDAGNAVAAEALIPIYEKANAIGPLSQALRIQLEHTRDFETRQSRMKRLSALLAHDAGDAAGALEVALRAFAEGPTSEWACEETERLAAQSGQWAALAEVFESSLPAVPDASRRLAILLVLARAYEKELANPEIAIEHNQEILEISPKQEEAVSALERLFVATGRFAQLLAVYDKKLQIAKSKAEQMEIRFKLASLYEDEIKQPAKAIELYQAILKQDAAQLPALHALDRLYFTTGQWAELSATIDREIALSSTPTDIADLKFRRGRLQEQRLKDSEAAVASFREALELVPSHEAARTALQAYLADPERQMIAVGVLEPIYEQTFDLARLVEIQKIKLARETNPTTRVTLLLRIGKLHQNLGDTDGAGGAYAKAFSEDPSAQPAREALESLATAGDRWAALVKLYEGALTKKLPPGLTRELLQVIAIAYDEKLGQSDKAVEYFRRAQEILPQDVSALAALERLYTRTQRWPDLIETLRKKADLVTEAEERIAIRIRIATVWDEMLGNTDEAIFGWKDVLAESPDNVRALRALDRLYLARGDFRDLADNLQLQLQLTSLAADRVALLVRLGQLREMNLGHAGAAVDTYRLVLEIDPEHPDAIAALSRILPNPEFELQVAQLLEPVFRANGDYQNLVRVQEVIAAHANNPEEKIATLAQIAEAYEIGLDAPERAYDALARALHEDPLQADVQSQIERLARALGKMGALVELYQELVPSISDVELRGALYHKIARLCESELHRDQDAAAAYAAALDASPRDLVAANALESIYLRSGDYVRLVGLLLRKAEIVSAPAEKKDLYFKAAQLHEEVLESLDKAIDVYRLVLTVDDSDPVALDNLERLFIRLSLWNELKDIYAKKAQLATSPAERKQMLFVLGQVHDRELQNPERAIETYSSILDIDPDDYDAAAALDRLYQKTERWYDLLAILERQTEMAPTPAEVVSLRFRIGELWRENLNDVARAVESYRAVLALDPSHEPTLQSLEGLMAGLNEPVLAAQVLEPIYESAGEWEKVVAVFEVMAAHAGEPAQKVERLRHIAEIEERRLSHQSAAFEAYGRALQVDSGNEEILAHLERLAAETNGWERLARLFARELERNDDSSRRVQLLLRLARIHEEETNAHEDAIADYQRVLAVDSENVAALEALDRLFVREQRWEDLADVVRKEVHVARSESDAVDLTFRLAQIFELALGDTRGAIAAYRDVLKVDPNHAETRGSLERMFVGGTHQGDIADVLEPLYRENQEWEKLARIYEVQLGQLQDRDERQALLRRLAETTEYKLVDQIAAFGWWAQAVKEDPSGSTGMTELLRLVRSTHQWDEYVETMFDASSRDDLGPGVRRDVLMRLASVFEVDLRDLERAEKVLVQAISDNEKDGPALEALDRIYVAQGMYENLAAVLRQRIAITDDATEVVTLHLRLGRVDADALDDVDGAIASYLAVLEHQSRSSEALEALERLYFRSERWAELFGVYEKLVDIAGDDNELADTYARMAKIASDALSRRDQAVDLWARVLDLRANDAVALAGLADLHEGAGEWKELTEVLERLVGAVADPEAQIPIYKRLGRIWGEKLNRERNALESWQKVLEIDSQDVDALRAIVDNYRSAGAWEELSEALRRLIGVAQLGDNHIEQAELQDLYSQLGELEGETLMRTQEAIEAWREVLEIDADDFRALAALEKLFIQEARWEDAVDILERRAQALANPSEQVDVLMQAASLWADRIGDGGSAAEVYERILQIDPSHHSASVELEQLYRQRKSWMKLIDLLLARTEFVGDTTSRIQILAQIAETYEKELGDRESAFVTLQAAFREDYSNDQVARELERLATAIGRWNELISDYTQVVQTISEPKPAGDLWVKIARWYDSALGHLDYAVASAQQALALDPGHIDALGALEDFYRKQKKWADLVAVLSKHADLEPSVPGKVQLLLALADAYETQIGDAAQATYAYQRALDFDERCLDAITALERLYRRTQAWDRLVDVLAKKALVVDDTDLAVRLRLQVGELWEDRLGDNDRAVESYKEVLSVDPQNLAALKALDSLYQKTGNMEAYLENMEHQLEVSAPEGDRVEIYQRMAGVWEEQFGKTDRASDVLEKILLVDDRNQKAYRDLERIYALDKKWESLVETYRKHILVSHDQNERIDLYTKTGEVLENELRDLDRAIDAYNDALNFEPSHLSALAGLGRLYEETAQWERAVDVMRRLVVLATTAKERVDLNYRLGKIHDEHLRAPEAAEEFLVESLAQDATHVPSMLSLLALYKRRGDWVKAAQLMVRAEANTPNPLEKTRLLHEAAKIYAEKLGDEDTATRLYARVIDLDPEQVESAEPLSELYFKRKEWAPLVPLMETLARKAGKKTNREMTQLYHRLAKAADQVGDSEKALKYYKQSYDLDATYLPTLIDRAALLYRLEHWDDAFRIYQTILVHHRDSQKDEEIVDLFFRLGRIKLKLGERPKAVNMFDKALEIQAGHRPTLSALIDLYSDSNDWEAVIKQKRALLLASPTVDEKFAINEQIAGIYKDKLNIPQKAIAAHLEALELRPTDRQLLHHLLDLFSDTKQWKKAIEILVKLADLAAGKVKARFLVAAGNIANYELHSTDDAVEFLNQALDADPDDLKAFERIDKIMTAKKDWRNQERSYRRMIKRLGADPPAEKRDTQIALWHALGEIYRSRLKDYKAATAAFEVAVSLNKTDLRRRQILAELYQLSGPDSYDKAVQELRFLVKNTAEPGDAAGHLKTLHRLYLEMQLYDRAWCVASTLTFLRKADPEEQQFFEQYRAKGFVRAKARLTEELWQRNIYHPDEDRFISHIFASVSMAVAAAYAKEHKDWGLKRKDRRDVPNDQLLFSKVFSYLVQVMAVPQPELFLRPESPGELDLANAREKAQLTPSFVVGASLLQGRAEKELAYLTAKKLTWMRPDHFVRWPTVVPTMAQLRVVFLAALRLAQPAFTVKPELAQPVTQYLEFLRRLIPPQMLEQLTVVVQRFMASKAEADITRWATAADFTATRAGFLMCNDLDVAARLVQGEPIALGSAEPKDKIRDLVQWSVSDEYFVVREHLGMTIG